MTPEVLKLARVLGRPPEELGYLEAVPPEDLAVLREQITEALYAGDRQRFQRLAQGAAVIPGQLAAAIAQRALGPVLCARLAGLVDADKAADVARRLPTAFLADVATEIDPRRAAAVIAKVSPGQVADVAAELTARHEAVTLGRFVAYVSDDGLRAALPRIDDGTLLRTAFVMEGRERLGHLVALLPEERIAAIVRVAEDEGLWPEALDLLAGVDAALQQRLVAAARELGLLERLGPLGDELR